MANFRTTSIPPVGRVLVRLLLPIAMTLSTWAQTKAPGLDRGATSFDSATRQYLFGDWGGLRPGLAEQGIVFDFFYISDSQGNPVGGHQQSGTTWQRVRGTIDIDFGRLTRWQGLRFHATGLWQTG